MGALPGSGSTPTMPPLLLLFLLSPLLPMVTPAVNLRQMEWLERKENAAKESVKHVEDILHGMEENNIESKLKEMRKKIENVEKDLTLMMDNLDREVKEKATDNDDYIEDATYREHQSHNDMEESEDDDDNVEGSGSGDEDDIQYWK